MEARSLSPYRPWRWPVVIGLALGLTGLAGPVVVGPGGAAARADGMKEPLSPQPSSLAPVETEAFRQRYGQEALFRLKLGVDAGERAPGPVPGRTVACEAEIGRAHV